MAAEAAVTSSLASLNLQSQAPQVQEEEISVEFLLADALNYDYPELNLVVRRAQVEAWRREIEKQAIKLGLKAPGYIAPMAGAQLEEGSKNLFIFQSPLNAHTSVQQNVGWNAFRNANGQLVQSLQTLENELRQAHYLPNVDGASVVGSNLIDAFPFLSSIPGDQQSFVATDAALKLSKKWIAGILHILKPTFVVTFSREARYSALTVIEQLDPSLTSLNAYNNKSENTFMYQVRQDDIPYVNTHEHQNGNSFLLITLPHPAYGQYQAGPCRHMYKIMSALIQQQQDDIAFSGEVDSVWVDDPLDSLQQLFKMHEMALAYSD